MTAKLIIDPPVGPTSGAAAMRAWLSRLAQLRAQYAGDADAQRAIHDAQRQAESWLRLADDRVRDIPPGEFRPDLESDVIKESTGPFSKDRPRTTD